jgi:Integrase core domain
MAAARTLSGRGDQDDALCRGPVRLHPMAVAVSPHESVHSRHPRFDSSALARLPTRDHRGERGLQVRVGGGSRWSHTRPADYRHAPVCGIQSRWNDCRGRHRRTSRILIGSNVDGKVERSHQSDACSMAITGGWSRGRRRRHVCAGSGRAAPRRANVGMGRQRRRVGRWPVASSDRAGAAWTCQQLRESFPDDATGRFLLHDGDATFDAAFRRTAEAFGLTSVRTAPRSPWQNPYVERVIGSIRRECLDHVIVLNERHLQRVLVVLRRVLPALSNAPRARQGRARRPRHRPPWVRTDCGAARSRRAPPSLRTGSRLNRPRLHSV